MPFLLLGLVSIGWSGYSLVTGKGYYKGCPPGGYDRSEHPLNYWAPTLIILAIGICMLLVFFGLIPPTHPPTSPLTADVYDPREKFESRISEFQTQKTRPHLFVASIKRGFRLQEPIAPIYRMHPIPPPAQNNHDAHV